LDQQNETKRKVEVMRQRVQEWESKRMARQLSMAFNTLQQESLSRGAARQHWLKGASMAAALNLAAGPTGSGLTQKSQPTEEAGMHMQRVSSIAEMAHQALEQAVDMPAGQVDTARAWKAAEELFLQGCEALGHSRDTVKADVVASFKSSGGMSMAKMRWKSACTMVSTMLTIDRANAAKVHLHTRCLVDYYTAVEPSVTEVRATGVP
jgi:hypothetical protein